MKERLTAIVGSVISAIVALLGFSGCDDSSSQLDMYGTPYGDFRVSGLVTDEEGAPVNKARIIVRPYGFGDRHYIPQKVDTLSTDMAGMYNGEISDFPSTKIVIVCEDPKGAYKTDSVEVKPKYENGDNGWYSGVATAEVNFKLKKEKEN